jgi:hypothetical protein
MGMTYSTRLRILVKAFEPLGYEMTKTIDGIAISRHAVPVYTCMGTKEAFAFFMGMKEAHPFSVKVWREYLERLDNESLASNRKPQRLVVPDSG